MWLDKFSARVFSWNREGQYLLFYLLTVCCFMFPIEYLHIELKYSTIFDLRILLPQGKPVGDTLSAFAPTVGDAFLLSLPLFFFTNKRWVVFIPLFLFDVFCLVQTLYARVYEDIMPYSSFLLVNNVNDVLLNSVRGLIRLRDIFVFFPTLTFGGVYFLFQETASLSVFTYQSGCRLRIVVDSFVFLCGQSSSYLSSCAFRSRVSVDGFHYAL